MGKREGNFWKCDCGEVHILRDGVAGLDHCWKCKKQIPRTLGEAKQREGLLEGMMRDIFKDGWP